MSYLIDDKVYAASTDLVLDTEEFKQHARIDFSDDDALIASYLSAATTHTENLLGRALLTQTREARFSEWPSTVVLPTPQVASVTSVVYVDADRAEQTYAAASYYVSNLALPWAQARIVPSSTWPTTSDDDHDVVRIRYVCGYGDPADVPEPIRQAIRLLAAHWYEHREEVLTGTISKNIEMAYRSLTEPYRFRRVFD